MNGMPDRHESLAGPTRFAGRVRDVLLRPRHALRDVAEPPRPGAALAAVLCLGLGWSLVCLLAHAAGVRPPRPGPLGATYLAQAPWVTPVCLAAWGGFALVGRGLARVLGGRGALASLLATSGLALAVPLTAAFVLPDAVQYTLELAGVGRSRALMALYLPLAWGWALVLLALAVRETEALPWGRTLLVVLGALALGAWPVPLLLR